MDLLSRLLNHYPGFILFYFFSFEVEKAEVINLFKDFMFVFWMRIISLSVCLTLASEHNGGPSFFLSQPSNLG